MGPYAATTSLRDSAIWLSENGVTVQWTAMGRGNVDWVRYFDRFRELCPNVPVHIETISGFNREIPFLTEEFMTQFADMNAGTLSRYIKWARTGNPRQPWKAPVGPNADR